MAEVQVYGDGRAVSLGAPVSGSQPRHLMFAPDLQPADVLYQVQAGDSLRSITESFFGSGEE